MTDVLNKTMYFYRSQLHGCYYQSKLFLITI